MLNILLFVLMGFIAQMIDGALGMAYGVTSNSLLMSIGVAPAAASASVHISEIFTTFISGISHFKLGNINKEMVKRLLIPGVLGGVTGAYILSNIDGNVLKPYIAIYLLLMGVRILIKALRYKKHSGEYPAIPGKIKMAILGLVGGFFDAIGGGGWGPIVTTTLISNGHSPRESIGSVNLTEFFVTFAEAITFIIALFGQKMIYWQVVVGLIIGGAIAAPFGAMLTRKIPTRVLLYIVAGLIIGLQIRTLLLLWVL